MSVDEFEALLSEIRWFGSIGAPTADPVPRLASWEAWPGPEDPLVEMMHRRQQELYDELIGTGTEASQLEAIFNRVRERVLGLASARVPYDPVEDTWHPPSTAVWHAGWTAGLMALCTAVGRTPPQELRTQWDWFTRGHWPAAYYGDPEPGGEARFIVFYAPAIPFN